MYVDEMVLRDRDPTGSGTLSERLWVQQDANWNVTALVNTSGSVAERYVYDPYGNITFLSAAWGTLSGSAYAWIYGHQGGRFDATTGLYYFDHRDLSAILGRWTQVDPMRFRAGDENLYRYVGNAPTNLLDPAGLNAQLVGAGGFQGESGQDGDTVWVKPPPPPPPGFQPPPPPPGWNGTIFADPDPPKSTGPDAGPGLGANGAGPALGAISPTPLPPTPRLPYAVHGPHIDPPPNPTPAPPTNRLPPNGLPRTPPPGGGGGGGGPGGGSTFFGFIISWWLFDWRVNPNNPRGGPAC